VNATASLEGRKTDAEIVQGRSETEHNLSSASEIDQQMNLVTGFFNDSFVSEGFFVYKLSIQLNI